MTKIKSSSVEQVQIVRPDRMKTLTPRPLSDWKDRKHHDKTSELNRRGDPEGTQGWLQRAPVVLEESDPSHDGDLPVPSETRVLVLEGSDPQTKCGDGDSPPCKVVVAVHAPHTEDTATGGEGSLPKGVTPLLRALVTPSSHGGSGPRPLPPGWTT